MMTSAGEAYFATRHRIGDTVTLAGTIRMIEQLTEADPRPSRFLRFTLDVPAAATPLVIPGSTSTELTTVLLELLKERRHQIGKGYTPEHDDQHEVPDLVTLAVDRLARYEQVLDPRPIRQRILEAAAMLVAALEVIDRDTARG